MSSVEATLNALRRMPENRFCGTCRKEDRFGHKNACMKFRIFICSDCKSAHQAFSHKCKSITMSNWSKAEVDELKAPNGGNARNFATTFAKLDKESDVWPRGCEADEVKAFVLKAYDQLRWHDASGAPRAERTVSAPDVGPVRPDLMAATRAAPSFSTSSASAPKVSLSRTAPLPSKTMDADLLCDPLGAYDPFGAFGDFGGHIDHFDDDFSGTTTTTPAKSSLDEWSGFSGSAPVFPAADVSDPFGEFESANTPASMAPAPMAAPLPMGSPMSQPVSKAAAPPAPHAAPVSDDPFSALGASGFSALGASAPVVNPLASCAADTTPAKPALSGVGVAKVLSTGAAAAPTGIMPAVMPAGMRYGSMAGGVAGGPLGAEFIDTAALRAPPQRMPPMMAGCGVPARPGMPPMYGSGMATA